MKLLSLLGRLDAWLDPALEVIVGCIVLVGSAGFWIEPRGPIWNHVALTTAAILGPVVVYRAWKRKPLEVTCDNCGAEATIVEHDDEQGHLYIVNCSRCGMHPPP